MPEASVEHFLIFYSLIKDPIKFEVFYSLVEFVLLVFYYQDVVGDSDDLVRAIKLQIILFDLISDRTLALKHLHTCFLASFLFVCLERPDSNKNFKTGVVALSVVFVDNHV